MSYFVHERCSNTLAVFCPESPLDTQCAEFVLGAGPTAPSALVPTRVPASQQGGRCSPWSRCPWCVGLGAPAQGDGGAGLLCSQQWASSVGLRAVLLQKRSRQRSQLRPRKRHFAVSIGDCPCAGGTQGADPRCAPGRRPGGGSHRPALLAPGLRRRRGWVSVGEHTSV